MVDPQPILHWLQVIAESIGLIIIFLAALSWLRVFRKVPLTQKEADAFERIIAIKDSLLEANAENLKAKDEIIAKLREEQTSFKECIDDLKVGMALLQAKVTDLESALGRYTLESMKSHETH